MRLLACSSCPDTPHSFRYSVNIRPTLKCSFLHRQTALLLPYSDRDQSIYFRPVTSWV